MAFKYKDDHIVELWPLVQNSDPLRIINKDQCCMGMCVKPSYIYYIPIILCQFSNNILPGGFIEHNLQVQVPSSHLSW